MKIAFVLLLAFSLQPSAFASTVTLAWDPSPGTNVIAGYNLYYGPAPVTYTNVIHTSTNCTCTITVPAGTTYLVCTAVDVQGLESDYSNEISCTDSGTNQILTITTTGTTLLYARSLAGPWTATNAATITLINPIPPIYFRSRGWTSNQVRITASPF